MRKLSLFLLQFIFLSAAFGQSTEYSIHLNSGLFSFGGNSATKTSFIILDDVASDGNYTNNPYGIKKTLSYGLAIQVQRVTGNHTIFGVQLGYELLKSRVTINRVSAISPNAPSSAEGQTTLTTRFINLYPNIGHRFPLQNFKVDIMFGPEIGWNLNIWETGKATLNDNTTVTTDKKRHSPGTDFRLRSALTVYYKNWGISTGYSYGLHNYSSGIIGAKIERYARFIRFGIIYKIK